MRRRESRKCSGSRGPGALDAEKCPSADAHVRPTRSGGHDVVLPVLARSGDVTRSAGKHSARDPEAGARTRVAGLRLGPLDLWRGSGLSYRRPGRRPPRVLRKPNPLHRPGGASVYRCSPGRRQNGFALQNRLGGGGGCHDIRSVNPATLRSACCRTASPSGVDRIRYVLEELDPAAPSHFGGGGGPAAGSAEAAPLPGAAPPRPPTAGAIPDATLPACA